MKAAYVKAPFEFEIRDVGMRDLKDDEVVVDIKSCGICGTDLHTAATEAEGWQPFGHEIAGVVEKIGSNVDNVSKGEKVVLESGTFCRYCNVCRNGRVDLCNQGPNYWLKGPMGFAEKIIVPRETVVPFTGMSFREAALVEPLGVALDLIYTAEPEINDDVLVIGLGPIGLMALRLARTMGARNVYGAELSEATRRIELAREFGADEVICTDKEELEKYDFARGGLDKVMVTAPPKLIPPALRITNKGGTVAFIGIEYGDGADITFDANDFHFNKLQLKASFASPALYFPRCIELINSDKIDAEALISDTFELDNIDRAMKALRDDKANSVKIVMVRE